jgi:hypothetical protein
VRRVTTAATTIFSEFQATRRILFIFRRNVVAFFTLRALQNYIISWH